MKCKHCLLFVIVMLIAGCQSQSPNVASGEANIHSTRHSNEDHQRHLRALASNFFVLYSKRQDLETFLQYYSNDVVLEDLVFGERIEGKEQLRSFYRWNSGEVELIGKHALTVTEQLVSGNHVVTRGQFLPFYYHGQKMGPWRFVIWQEFNQSGLIIKQFDWINYTPKETFIGGENLNGNNK